jgi:transcriptional regulator with XRE-family HTH domain
MWAIRVAKLQEETPMDDHRDFYGEIGRRVRAARKAQTLTQEALASLVSLTRTSITNIEKGRQKMLLHTFADLAAALQVEYAALLPDSPVASRDADLQDALEGRPLPEQQFVKSAVESARAGG